jgi:hypothetical protein
MLQLRTKKERTKGVAKPRNANPFDALHQANPDSVWERRPCSKMGVSTLRDGCEVAKGIPL